MERALIPAPLELVEVGILQVELDVGPAQSLKDKRRVVRSVLDRVRGSFNVSAAEVDALDKWQRAILGFAAVGNDPSYVRGLLDKLVDHLRRHPEARLLDYQIELM